MPACGCGNTCDSCKAWHHADYGDGAASAYLQRQGFKLHRDWSWETPYPLYDPTKAEWGAIVYLIKEWDWGGLRS